MTELPLQSVTVPPEVDEDTRPWWDSLAEGRLWIPRCEDCSARFFPPLPRCPRCAGTRIAQVDSKGVGVLYSWIVVHVALDPAFADETPYTVAAVTLAEGVRLFGRIAAGELRADLPVQAVIYQVDGVTLLGFERC